MIFYFLVATISIFFYKIAERSRNKIVFVIAALIPIIIEGLRNDNIGTDMVGYGTVWFYNMKISDGLFRVLRDASTPEYGFHFLVYLGKCISSDIHVYLSLCAIIKISVVYYTLYKFRHHINTALFLVFYFSFFYFVGFSMMRQSLALAVSFLSLWFLYNRKFIPFFVCTFFAYMFHSSALLMLVVFYLYISRGIKHALIINFIILLITFFSVPIIMDYFIGSSLFKEGMAEQYMDSGVASAKTNLVISFFLLIIQPLFSKEKSTHKDFIFNLLTISFTLASLFLSSYIEVAFRMSYYFLIPSVLGTFMLLNQKQRNVRREYMVIFFLLMLLHYYISCSHGMVDTIPYHSSLLDI